MNFEEIKELIKLVSKTGVGKVQVEKEDCKDCDFGQSFF